MQAWKLVQGGRRPPLARPDVGDAVNHRQSVRLILSRCVFV